MKQHPEPIDLSKLTGESSELPLMVLELEGGNEEQSSPHQEETSKRWAARFATASDKRAPVR